MHPRFAFHLAAERQHDLLLEACRDRLIADALGPRDSQLRTLISYVAFALTGTISSARPARRPRPLPVPAACNCGA